MTKKIIIISGKQFSGKDTLAKFILEFKTNFKRVGIGDAIKLEYGRRKNLTFDEIEKNKHLYRADLIELGNWGREQDADYWLKRIIDMNENVIIPDIRVPHELEVFKSYGAVSIRVEAPRNNRALRGTLAKENDPTETLLDSIQNWDYIIQNDGSLDDLKQKAFELSEKL